MEKLITAEMRRARGATQADGVGMDDGSFRVAV